MPCVTTRDQSVHVLWISTPPYQKVSGERGVGVYLPEQEDLPSLFSGVLSVLSVLSVLFFSASSGIVVFCHVYFLFCRAKTMWLAY